MKRILNSFFSVCLLASSMLIPVSAAKAQTVPEPAIVISIAEMDKQVATANYLATAAGFGDMKFLVQTMIKQYTKGIDGKRPSGVLMYFSEQSPTPEFLVFMPVSNLDDFLDIVATVADVDDEDDMSVISTPDGMEVMVKEIGDHAFMTSNVEIFQWAPADPGKFLQDQPQRYNIAAKIYGGRIPEELRTMAMDEIRKSYEEQMSLMDEDAAQSDIQDFNWKQFEQYLNEMDSILVGMNADSAQQRLHFDFEVLAKAGSELADKFAKFASADLTSLFNGFLLDNAAMTFHSCAPVDQEDIEQYQKLIEGFPSMLREEMEDEDLSEEDIEVLGQAAEDATKIFIDMLRQGKVDGGAALVVAENDLNFAAGVALPNPRELEDVVKRLVPMVEEKLGGEIQVELNSGSHRDVTFHRFVIDTPDDLDGFYELFGEQLVLTLGIGQQAAYLGLGSDPEALIRQVMDNPGPTAPQPFFQMNFFVANLIKIGTLVEDDPTARRMYQKLADEGNDRIRIVSEYVENGFRTQFEIQDGVLSLIKVAVDGMFSGGMDDFDDEF